MVGIDTVKLLSPLPFAARLHLNEALSVVKNGNGRKGVVWWQSYDVPELGTRLVAKGVGASSGFLIWEGSVPKVLGSEGVCAAEDVRPWVGALQDATGGLFDASTAYCGRVDCTRDVYDPDGDYRRAAVGWKPHDRARYVQAVYQGLETVWLHNKTRGVRVYDKHAEDGREWSEGLTRIEYQVRGDWVAKLGLRSPLSDVFAGNVAAAVQPVVDDLAGRVADLR